MTSNKKDNEETQQHTNMINTRYESQTKYESTALFIKHQDENEESSKEKNKCKIDEDDKYVPETTREGERFDTFECTMEYPEKPPTQVAYFQNVQSALNFYMSNSETCDDLEGNNNPSGDTFNPQSPYLGPRKLKEHDQPLNLLDTEEYTESPYKIPSHAFINTNNLQSNDLQDYTHEMPQSPSESAECERMSVKQSPTQERTVKDMMYSIDNYTQFFNE